MVKPPGIELRSRLVAAVAGGARPAVPRRARFGVSAASAVRWMQAVRRRGTVEAKPQGGDAPLPSHQGIQAARRSWRPDRRGAEGYQPG